MSHEISTGFVGSIKHHVTQKAIPTVFPAPHFWDSSRYLIAFQAGKASV